MTIVVGGLAKQVRGPFHRLARFGSVETLDRNRVGRRTAVLNRCLTRALAHAGHPSAFPLDRLHAALPGSNSSRLQVNSRGRRGSGCRQCWYVRRGVLKATPKPGQSLAEQRPALAAEWHPTKNGDLKPSDVKPAKRGALAELDCAGAKIGPRSPGIARRSLQACSGMRSPMACWRIAVRWSCRAGCCRRSSARCWAVRRSAGTVKRRGRRCL